ncbi:hypothetical protein ACFX1X_029618 [Malus domestica]
MMFNITDGLIVRPISPLFGISVLNEMKVQNLKVGREEVTLSPQQLALRLLVTSFRSDSALTRILHVGRLKEFLHLIKDSKPTLILSFNHG